MEEKRIVIIGLGGAGFSAAMSAIKFNRKAKITLVEKRDFDMCSPCALPFVIEGRIRSFEDVIHEFPAESMGMTKLLRHEAISINTEEKRVEIKELETERLKTLDYDSLIIATGSNPFIPPIPGAREMVGRGVYVVGGPKDAREIYNAIKGKKRAFVVGAGAIGLEIAIALREKGLDVTVAEMLPNAFPNALDKDMSKILENYLSGKGIKLLMNQAVEKIVGDDWVESVIAGGQSHPAEMIIMASGVRANVDLARNAGIQVGKWAILTDERMETSVKDVYAIGDCVQVKSAINNEAWMMQLATAAYKQGQIAGVNAAGGDARYDGALTTFVSVIGDLEVAATGFNEHFAKTYGYKTVVGKAKGETKPHWFPGGKEITVKILANAENGRILGCQAVGEGAAWRVNVVAMAMKMKGTVYDLSNTELAYCPAISETYDVLLRATDFAIRRLER